MIAGPSKDPIESAVINALQAAVPNVGAVDAQTALLGPTAVVDSIGFISLLIALEQHFDNRVDLSTSFLEQQGVADSDNPFRSIAALTAHLERLLGKD